MDLRPALEPIWAAFSLPATLTPPAGQAVSVRAVWITPQTVEVPIGLEARVAEAKRTLALLREEVASVPRGTRIVVAEISGASPREWTVDGFGRIETEIVEVLVVPA
jgi:hypothetical protein